MEAALKKKGSRYQYMPHITVCGQNAGLVDGLGLTQVCALLLML
jgi:hypothetical protein